MGHVLPAAIARPVLDRFQDWLQVEQEERKRLEELISATRESADGLVEKAKQCVYNLRSRTVLAAPEDTRRKKTAKTQAAPPQATSAAIQQAPLQQQQQRQDADSGERVGPSGSVPGGQARGTQEDRTAGEDGAEDGAAEAGTSTAAAAAVGHKRGRTAARGAGSSKRTKAQPSGAASTGAQTVAEPNTNMPMSSRGTDDDVGLPAAGSADDNTAPPVGPLLSQAEATAATAAAQQGDVPAQAPRRSARARGKQAAPAAELPQRTTRQSKKQLQSTVPAPTSAPAAASDPAPVDQQPASAEAAAAQAATEAPADAGVAGSKLGASQPGTLAADGGSMKAVVAEPSAAGHNASAQQEAQPSTLPEATTLPTAGAAASSAQEDGRQPTGTPAPDGAPEIEAQPRAAKASKKQKTQPTDTESGPSTSAAAAAPQAAEQRVTRSRRGPAAAVADEQPSSSAAPVAVKPARGKGVRQKRDMQEAQLGSPGMHPKCRQATDHNDGLQGASPVVLGMSAPSAAVPNVEAGPLGPLPSGPELPPAQEGSAPVEPSTQRFQASEALASQGPGTSTTPEPQPSLQQEEQGPAQVALAPLQPVLEPKPSLQPQEAALQEENSPATTSSPAQEPPPDPQPQEPQPALGLQEPNQQVQSTPGRVQTSAQAHQPSPPALMAEPQAEASPLRMQSPRQQPQVSPQIQNGPAPLSSPAQEPQPSSQVKDSPARLQSPAQEPPPFSSPSVRSPTPAQDRQQSPQPQESPAPLPSPTQEPQDRPAPSPSPAQEPPPSPQQQDSPAPLPSASQGPQPSPQAQNSSANSASPSRESAPCLDSQEACEAAESPASLPALVQEPAVSQSPLLPQGELGGNPSTAAMVPCTSDLSAANAAAPQGGAAVTSGDNAKHRSSHSFGGGFCFGVKPKEQSSPDMPHFGLPDQGVLATDTGSPRAATTNTDEAEAGPEAATQSPLSTVQVPVPAFSGREGCNAAEDEPMLVTAGAPSEDCPPAASTEVADVGLEAEGQRRSRSLSLAYPAHGGPGGPNALEQALALSGDDPQAEGNQREASLAPGAEPFEQPQPSEPCGRTSAGEEGACGASRAEEDDMEEAASAEDEVAGDSAGAAPCGCEGSDDAHDVQDSKLDVAPASGGASTAHAPACQSTGAGQSGENAAPTGSVEAAQANGPKSSNLVSCVRSFLPVKMAPSPPPAAGKKPVKVKALEAAQAIKQKEAAKAAERAQARAAAADRHRQGQAELATGNGASAKLPAVGPSGAPASRVTPPRPTRPALPGQPQGPGGLLSNSRPAASGAQAAAAVRATPSRSTARPDNEAPTASGCSALPDEKRTDAMPLAAAASGSVRAKAAFFQQKAEQVKPAGAEQSVGRKAAAVTAVPSVAPAAPAIAPTSKAGALARVAPAAGESEAVQAAAAGAQPTTSAAATASSTQLSQASTRAAPPAAGPVETVADKQKRVEQKRREEEERRRAELEARAKAKDDKLRNFEAAKQQQRMGGAGGTGVRPGPPTGNPLAVYPPGKRQPLNNVSTIMVKPEKVEPENLRTGPVGPNFARTPGPKGATPAAKGARTPAAKVGPAAKHMVSPAVQMQIKLLPAVSTAAAEATASKAHAAQALTTAGGGGAPPGSSKPLLPKPPAPGQGTMRQQGALGAAAAASVVAETTPGGVPVDLTEEDKRNVHAIQTSPYVGQVKPRTPRVATSSKKPFVSYEISPYRDDEDESDEDVSPGRPRKPVPEWASSHNILEALRRQVHLDADAIFGACPLTIDIVKVFSDMPPPPKTDMRGRPRRDYKRRGSSGIWDADE